MSIYVDDMKASFGRMIMCHMVADTHHELVEMARKIGVAVFWIQKMDTADEHFDICKSKRARTIAAGAIATRGEVIACIRRKRAAAT
jgi:Protein of unknown function (DUF4031)